VLLCIDIGNTNTVLATFDGEKIIHSWRVKTEARNTADELGLLFRGLLSGDNVQITGVAACSTVPAALRTLRTMLGRYYAGVPAVIVEPGVKTGVQLAIDNPKEVGSDRVVNTLAAFHLYGGPAIVVDFGTSTNFDAISERGEFLGGVLAPGIEISVEALEAYAAGARFVMADNMSVELLADTVRALREQAEDVEIESTGGLTLDVAREYALTGVDYLSVGGLTHSSPILDLALDLAD